MIILMLFFSFQLLIRFISPCERMGNALSSCISTAEFLSHKDKNYVSGGGGGIGVRMTISLDALIQRPPEMAPKV